LPDAFPRFRGKFLRRGLRQFVGMCVRRVPEKTDLLPVKTAPFAQEQVQPKTRATGRRQRLFERLRLEPERLAAGGHEQAPAGAERIFDWVQQIHGSSLVITLLQMVGRAAA